MRRASPIAPHKRLRAAKLRRQGMSYVGIERETGINESTIRRWVKRDPEWMLLVRGQGVLQVGPVKLQVDHNAPTFDDVGDESLAWVAPSLPASESAPDQRVLGSIAVENAEQLKVVLVPADRVQKVRDELAAGRIPYLPDAPTFPLRGDALPALTDPADVSLLCALASDDQAEAFRAFLSVWRFRAQETKDIRTLGDELWEAQDIFIEQMCANPHVYLLKARKLGQSTIAVAYAAFALRVRDTNARVHLFSRAERAALELLAAFKFGLDNLPTWLRLPMERETQREIVYSAGIHDMRHVISYPTSDATAVEATATHSHIDEWADMPRPDVVYQSLEPTFSAPGCTSLICTTGSGPANPSAAYFKDCLNGEGLHLPLFIPATARPGRDETWLAQKRRQMRVNAFRTEYALSWMDAIAGTAEYEFESEDIDRCTQYCRYRSDGHRLAVPFGQPLEKHRYITAVDVGGTGAFIWFLAGLRDALAVGGWTDRLARVAFGAGVAAAVLLACSFAPSLAGAGTFAFGDQRGISPDAAEALYALTDKFVVLAEFVAVVFFLAAGLVALRARVLPVWLAIVTLLLAALLLVLPIGFVGIIFLMPVWTIIVAIVLALRVSDTVAAPPS